MYDYLIVGQGIAGTSLAHLLLEEHRKVLIVNDESQPSSSRVAAGIFNPLTGKKLVKTWMADELFPYAATFYRAGERKLGALFYHPLNSFRPYRSVAEQNDYLALAADASVAAYVETNPDLAAYHHIHHPFGGLEVLGSGWVDIPLYLEASRRCFQRTDSYVNAAFREEDLRWDEAGISWQGLTFKNVILCQGVLARDQSFFGWLPFHPVKGQVLDLRVTDYGIRNIVNQGIFLLPRQQDMVRAGATYTWHDLDWEVTEDGRQYLEDKLRPLLKTGYQVTGQQAGIRPSVKDRRPLIGRHPDRPGLWIFNGFGSKGVTLVPFFARQLADHLSGEKELDPAVNIERYFSLFYQSNFPKH